MGDRIALYGSLMSGLGAMDALGLALSLRFEGPCMIPGRLFDLGAYPGLRPGPGRVHGEIYRLLDLPALTTLDEFEDFDPSRPADSLYLRERVQLLEPVGTLAWVYVYNREPSRGDRIAQGDWRAHLTSRNRDLEE